MRWIVPIVLVAAMVVELGAPREAPLDESELRNEAIDVERPSSIEALREKIAAVLARENVPGVGIALVNREGVIWSGGVGVTDRETKKAVDEHTIFRVASITKSIVGLGVMRLAEQRRLSLDRPIDEIVRDAPIDNAWDEDAPVTLAQALEHTAGLDDSRPNEVFVDDDHFSAHDALALNPRSRVIRWRPGERFAYSNVGYGLAGRAIEIATGEPFDRWLSREVLAPLGITDAGFARTEALRARMATGYHEDRAMAFRTFAHRAAGALLASPTDIAKLVHYWLRRGDGFPPIVTTSGLDRIERSGSLPYEPLDTDYGLGNGGDTSFPFRSRGHDGGLPGFLSTYRYFPELGVGFVLLFNATHSRKAYVEVRSLVYAYLAGDRRAVDDLPIANPPAAPYYAFGSPRHALVGFVDRAVIGWNTTTNDKGVKVTPLTGGPSVQLLPTRDGAYRIAGQGGSSIRFTRAKDGTPLMIGAAGYNEAADPWKARAFCLALGIGSVLLQLAPLWAAVAIALRLWRKQPMVAGDLILAPAIAGLALHAMPALYMSAAMDQTLGEVNRYTIGVCVASIVFAIASIASVQSSIRWLFRAHRPPFLWRVVPMLMSIAAAGYTAWFAANGIIGLRTWSW